MIPGRCFFDLSGKANDPCTVQFLEVHLIVLKGLDKKCPKLCSRIPHEIDPPHFLVFHARVLTTEVYFQLQTTCYHGPGKPGAARLHSCCQELRSMNKITKHIRLRLVSWAPSCHSGRRSYKMPIRANKLCTQRVSLSLKIPHSFPLRPSGAVHTETPGFRVLIRQQMPHIHHAISNVPGMKGHQLLMGNGMFT